MGNPTGRCAGAYRNLDLWEIESRLHELACAGAVHQAPFSSNPVESAKHNPE